MVETSLRIVSPRGIGENYGRALDVETAPASRLMRLPESALRLFELGSLAHFVTLNPDGSPQVSCVWVGLEDDEIVSGHLRIDQRKLKNVARDPRVALSIEGTEIHPPGLMEYLVVHGRARLVDGGAAELLQRLAYVYLGNVRFPPMDDPPPGCIMRVSVERIGGVGPWMSTDE